MFIFLVFLLFSVTNADRIKLYGNIDPPERPVNTFSFNTIDDFTGYYRSEYYRTRRETLDPVASEVKLKVNYIDYNYRVIVNWLGGDDRVIICQTYNSSSPVIYSPVHNFSSVYISYDNGDTFENKTDYFKLENEKYAPLAKLHTHPLYNTHFVFTIPEENMMYLTEDKGNHFKRQKLDFTPSEVSFHKLQPSIFVVWDKSGSNQKLWITNDFGESFRLLYEWVRSFFWLTDANSTEQLLVLTNANNASTIFITDPSKNNTTRIFMENVKDFFVTTDYIFFTRSNHKGERDLFVSHNLGKYLLCKFNSTKEIKAYYIVDISNDKALVAVAHANRDASLYVSENLDATGEKINFKLSLENIFLYLPYITWYEFIISPKRETFVDIHKAEGVPGVYIASKILELRTYPLYDRGIRWQITAIKHLASVITFDYGSKWLPIQPPTVDNDGKPINCRPDLNCSLHLSLEFTRFYSDLVRPTERIISSKSAPGMIIATGSLGSYLEDSTKLFISFDAGLTWKKVLDDSFFFGMGDHGGIMALLNYDESRNKYRDSFMGTMYSIDDGQSWKSMPFQFKELYGLMVEPGEKGTTFLTFGEHRYRGLIIKVDLSRASRHCTKEDFKWSPIESEQRFIPCTSNGQTFYQMRIPEALCLKGRKYVQLTKTEKCECTIDDIDCDIGFKSTRNPIGCIFDRNANSTDPFEVPSDCQPGSFYFRTRGYRQITNKVCERDFFLPDRIPCPSKEEDDFMLMVQDEKISRYNLNTKKLDNLPIGNMSDSVDVVDFDEKTNCVYWTEWAEQLIKRYCLGKDNEAEIFVSGVWVQRIALDWLSRNLYFLDSKKKSIQLIQVESPVEHRRLITILDDLGDAHTFDLHPRRGYLFWIDRSAAKLMRANMDGSGIVTLFQNNQLRKSRTITIDYIADRIYWVEHENARISSSDLQGRNFHHVHFDIGYAPLKIIVFKHKLYWINSKRGVSTADKDDLFGVEEIIDKPNRVRDLKVFGYGMRIGTNPCANSKCLDGCVAIPGDKFACVYRKGCWASAFFCTDGGCVSQQQRCDGSVNCYDGSDELDCNENSCTSKEFPCNNGKCMPSDWRCDGLDNCRDYSDERHCPTRFGSCKIEEFACRSGTPKCIPSTQLCDGEKNCQDGSDEMGCNIPRCPHGEFQCDVLAKTCIRNQWVCDRSADCPNRKDEQNCTMPHW